ncbi:hypothetical protein B9Z55_027115 [Caenorhabditis nigoni]|uniref:Uncharacterized protein n=1 Tax=Caenorhabditis nigoni TaxID=1611254 RepID=A0A2G5SJF6_9PELO|nr:hypothetical protein B9Z55_027115 [Caenorhabditis nigoni]
MSIERYALVLADCISLVPKVVQKYPEAYDEIAEVLALHTGGKIQLDDALAMMAPAAPEEPTAHEEGKPETQEETRVLVSRKRKSDGTTNEETIKRPRKDTGSCIHTESPKSLL